MDEQRSPATPTSLKPSTRRLASGRLAVNGSNGQESSASEAGRGEAAGRFVWSLDRSSDVGRALLAATRRLQESGSDTPQLDAAVLMAHVLGVNKAWLYAYPTRPLSADEIGRFEALVRRRMSNEPVAYLVGYKAFYGLDITVDRRVLIPRPETELLVERSLAYLKYLIDRGETPRVADIGTGSGAIAVAIAVNAPETIVYATDVSEDALVVAAQNVWRYGVGEQVQLLPGCLAEAVPEPVHLLVANLPYIATLVLADLAPQVRDHEPVLALDGGSDGLRIIAKLLDSLARPTGPTRLLQGAQIYLEIGSDQADAARSLAKQAFPGATVALACDYADLPRLVMISTQS